MKLKKLEISGFKSFVDKATIDFPSGISAVVGPNGCGKSNIVDALRWVMGEQSVKQLRGKSMEDVIFAGAAGRPPINMAEVSLTLNNDNGSVPEEFSVYSEIQVTRRLYRSGESGYFINKRPSRLKDINNLFFGSGLGPKTYAVIQQGNIGAITDAGPEERRFFVEEAAGVTRYKARKAEALRKIKNTQQNLLRLNDIITEINRRMASLKRQAGKARAYKRHQDDIRTMDVLLSIHYYQDYTKKIEETIALLSELHDLDEEHSSKLSMLDAAVEKVKLERLNKERELSTKRSRKFEAQRNADRMESDLSHLKQDVARLEQEVIDLDAAREDFFEKSETLMLEIAELEEKNKDSQARRETVKRAVFERGEESRGIRNRLDSLNQLLRNKNTALMELTAQEARYKNIYQTAHTNKQSLVRRLKQKDEEIFLAERRKTDLEQTRAKFEAELEELDQSAEEVAEIIEELKTELDDKMKGLSAQIKEVQTLEFERGKAKSSCSALKKMDENFEWYKDGVKAVMKLEEKKESVLGLVADIVSPNHSYENAVEAVLGEALQYVIVDSQRDGEDFIEHLKEKKIGRSGFIPLGSLKGLPGSTGNKPPAERLLLNHVTVKPGCEDVAEALLGHVAVTDDLSQAMEIFNRNGVVQTVVTKNGDLIDYQGIMLGGSEDNLSGILIKKQQIRTLEESIDAFTAKIEAGMALQEELEELVRDLETRLQENYEEQREIANEQTQAEKNLYKAGEDLKNADRHLEIVQLEQEQLLGEESDAEAEISKYSTALARIEEEGKAAQEEVKNTNREIETVSLELDDFNESINDLKMKLTTLEANIESGQGTLRRMKEYRDDHADRLEKLGIEIETKKNKKQSSVTRIESSANNLTGTYDELKGMEKDLEENEALFQGIEDELKQNDGIIIELQGKRESSLKKVRILEVEQSTNKLKRDNIASRMFDRYHKTLAELNAEFTEAFEETDLTQADALKKMEEDLADTKTKLSKIGDVNLSAIAEYEENKERSDFLEAQKTDLENAITDLQRVIKKINKITQEKFIHTFNLINEKLSEVFPRLFEGGSAKLILTEPDRPLETGVEFMISPPGKKLTRLSLLSGGEKALSAIAFVFSIFMIKPAAFCLMDEIDAPLDEANVFRFNNLLKLIGAKSQILMITHNKRSMEFADTLFGVTMEKKGVSKIVSVNLEVSEN